MRKDLQNDIVLFLQEHEAELSLSFNSEEERKLYAEQLIDGIRYYSLIRTTSTFAPEDHSTDFENEIKDAIQYKKRKETLDFLDSLDKQDARKRTDQNVKPKFVPIRQRPWGILAIAAAIALCITAGWWYWSSGFQPSGDLYQDYFNVPAHEYLMRSNDEVDPQIRQAFLQFDSGNYEVAARLLDDLYSQSRKSDFRFYEAISNMELKQFQKARQLLKELVENNPGNMEYRWYYALSFIALEENTNAITQLDTIINSSHFRVNLAEDLKRDLTQ